MTNGEGKAEGGRLSGDLIEAAGRKFDPTTPVKDVLDWLRGKREKPKPNPEEAKEETDN